MAEAAVLTRLARLLRELDIDLAALEARAAESSALAARATLSRPELMLLAVNLHAYYTGLETLLERVARLLDDELPGGANWHAELVEQMRTDVPGLRPALVDDEAAAELHELRKFRHFFRNAYFLDLDSTKVKDNAARLLRAHASLSGTLVRFRAHVASLLPP